MMPAGNYEQITANSTLPPIDLLISVFFAFCSIPDHY